MKVHKIDNVHILSITDGVKNMEVRPTLQEIMSDTKTRQPSTA